jgi:hypothetical protein
MNAIAKILAPVALATAALGAQASELTPGDIGAQPVTAGPAVAIQVTVPAGPNGEVTAGDIGAQPVVAGTTTREAPSQVARPVSLFAIGA